MGVSAEHLLILCICTTFHQRRAIVTQATTSGNAGFTGVSCDWNISDVPIYDKIIRALKERCLVCLGQKCAETFCLCLLKINV